MSTTGRILEEQGSEAYQAYVDRRKAEDPDAYTTWDELIAMLDEVRAE